jgi:hypothetical protein
MSITQTYYLAHTARGKLSSEAARADHNLRLLVGHANLLDSLMVELADAEREQESWFNASVKAASKTDRHIQWADSIVEEVEDPEEDWDASDVSDSSSEYDSDEELDLEYKTASFETFSQASPMPISTYEDLSDEEIEDDGEEDYDSLALTLSPSHSAPNSPPELAHDHESESESEDEQPPSPPATALPTFNEKQRQQIATTSYYEGSKSLYAPQRGELISAISVY